MANRTNLYINFELNWVNMRIYIFLKWSVLYSKTEYKEQKLRNRSTNKRSLIKKGLKNEIIFETF